jgi:hypothetical protein
MKVIFTIIEHIDYVLYELNLLASLLASTGQIGDEAA